MLAMIVGAAVWVAAPTITALRFGSLEHGFLSFPLVAAPLGLALAVALLRPEGRAAVLYDLARRMQPFAAASMLAAFLVERGVFAAVLVVPWIAMALAIAFAGITTVLRSAHPHLTRANLLVAHVFLPIGTVWLLMSRLGVGPSHMPAFVVMLAALHFHFSGYALQLLVAATARHVPTAKPGLARLQRAIAVLGVVGIPLIAAGNLARIEAMKTLGVATVVLVTLGLAVVATAVARAIDEAVPRRLLLVSAGSVGAAMLLATIFRIGEIRGTPWISVDDMVTTHGLLNVFGFVACGAIAHLRLAGTDHSVRTITA